jgi:hypothetical protein
MVILNKSIFKRIQQYNWFTNKTSLYNYQVTKIQEFIYEIMIDFFGKNFDHKMLNKEYINNNIKNEVRLKIMPHLTNILRKMRAIRDGCAKESYENNPHNIDCTKGRIFKLIYVYLLNSLDNTKLLFNFKYISIILNIILTMTVSGNAEHIRTIIDHRLSDIYFDVRFVMFMIELMNIE